MRNADNISSVASLGVDIIGLIFYPKSPRYVSDSSSPLPAGVYAGVFVNEEPDVILQHVSSFTLSYVQLHGDESPAYVRQLRSILPSEVRIIKAITIHDGSDISRCEPYDGLVDMFLFDTQCSGYGGSGEKFDWSILNQYNGSIPFLLSGGIGPEDANAVKAFRRPLCVGVDLNSRFELSPAMKDTQRLKHFIKEIKNKAYE